METQAPHLRRLGQIEVFECFQDFDMAHHNPAVSSTPFAARALPVEVVVAVEREATGKVTQVKSEQFLWEVDERTKKIVCLKQK